MKTEKQRKLSKREKQVMKGLIEEKLSHEIAKGLGLNEKTIGTYKTRIQKKLNVKTIIGMYKYNLVYKLVELDTE
jgi:DNA-binding NarL/FixJ family response regulator